MKNPPKVLVHLPLAISLSIIAFNFIGWPFQIRFTLAAINYWAAIFLAASLPIFILLSASQISKKYIKFSAYFIAFIVFLPAILFSFFAALEAPSIKSNTDLSYELISEVGNGSAMLRLYRTNCGATCAFGLDLRRELDTPVGIKFVRSIWSKYRTDPKATLRLNSSSSVQVLEGNLISAEVAI